MSRRHAATQREILPDVKYGSVLVARTINGIMQCGKKALAERIFYGACELIESKHKVDAFEIFKNAFTNVRPSLEVTSVRVGGANYQVPSMVDDRRGNALATRWILDASRKRAGRSMKEKLAEELFDASSGKGAAVKKKEDTLKMAEANKAFSHFSPKKNAR